MSASQKSGNKKRNSSKKLSPREAKMLRWLTSVQQECERLIETCSDDDRLEENFDQAAFSAWKVRTKLCLSELLGSSHVYYQEFCDNARENHFHATYTCRQTLHLLKSIREDLEQGYLESYRGLIQAEIHSDFLEMAQHLFDEGYKDACAVIAGSVLEDHLKKLCIKENIEMTVTKSNGNLRELTANELNDQLGKQKVYELPLQQAVKGWLAVRNCAAHGEYDKYSKGEVSLLLTGIRQFVQTQKL